MVLVMHGLMYVTSHVCLCLEPLPVCLGRRTRRLTHNDTRNLPSWRKMLLLPRPIPDVIEQTLLRSKVRLVIVPEPIPGSSL